MQKLISRLLNGCKNGKCFTDFMSVSQNVQDFLSKLNVILRYWLSIYLSIFLVCVWCTLNYIVIKDKQLVMKMDETSVTSSYLIKATSTSLTQTNDLLGNDSQLSNTRQYHSFSSPKEHNDNICTALGELLRYFVLLCKRNSIYVVASPNET